MLFIMIFMTIQMMHDNNDVKSIIFGPRVYPLGSLVIALVRPSVRVCVRVSVFKYLRDRSLVFSEILHEVAGQ